MSQTLFNFFKRQTHIYIFGLKFDSNISTFFYPLLLIFCYEDSSND